MGLIHLRKGSFLVMLERGTLYPRSLTLNVEDAASIAKVGPVQSLTSLSPFCFSRTSFLGKS